MLLIDTYNLYHGAYAVYRRRVDYDKLIYNLQSRYSDCVLRTRFAYVAQTEQSKTFESFLKSRQFSVRNKIIRDNKLDTFDVDLTMDVMLENDKVVVICSSSLNLLPLIKYLVNWDCVVSIHSCGIPYQLKEVCATQELPINVMTRERSAA